MATDLKSLKSLKELVMTVVNGLVSPGTILVQKAQDAAQRVIAEAKQMAEITKTAMPQQAKIAGEIAELETQKVAKITEIKAKDVEVQAIDSVIEVQEKALEVMKKAQETRKKAQDIKTAKAKSKGEPLPEQPTEQENAVRKEKERIDKQKEQSKQLHKELDTLNAELGDIEGDIEEKKYQLRMLAAQINPTGALAEAKITTRKAQEKVDGTPTPEARKEAQKELEAAQKEQDMTQQISDDNDTAIEQEILKNEPKMMQLRAEYQIMDSGVATIQYLTTNIPILIPAMMASIGANGGGPVPTLPTVTIPLGNILYGYGFFVLATVKAASIRFLALAQELGYTPTTEMAIINQIAPTEVAWKAAMAGFAPAGTVLI